MRMAIIENGPTDATLTVLLAHGAGAGMDTPFMNAIAEGLGELGWRVKGLSFLTWKNLESGRSLHRTHCPSYKKHSSRINACTGPVVLAGKSMGGRVATTFRKSSLLVVLRWVSFSPTRKPDSSN